MCGIVGFTDARGTYSTADKGHVLNRMLTRIRHRGPDETGLYISNECAMGNVRLSIVDLNSGQQPLSNEEGCLWIAYNGEVYNHLELKKQLTSLGHQFKTNCDTEVVLHMYEEYGEACLNKLNGQFAFSIWDEKRKKLFLARDRVGIRPLYYTHNQGEFIYASEIKCLFEYPNIERNLDVKGLKQVFTFWSALSPQTVFEGIREVPPGHFVVLEKGKLEIKPYWQHGFKHEKFTGSIDRAGEELLALLKDSVNLRLRADVQVAAYLSGGLDSSVTTALVKEIQPGVLNTFSIGFQDKQFDETNYQNEVALYLNTKHKSISCSNDDIADLLSTAIYHTETPILRTSPIPMMRLSSLVRKNNIKVVLTGEGADEMLGGYNIFKETLIRHFWAREPKSKFRPLLLKKLYPYIPQLGSASSSMLSMFFGYQLQETDSPVYSHYLRWRNGLQMSNLFTQDIKQELNGYNPVEEYANSIEQTVKGYSTLEKAQYIETNLFMSNYLLSSQGDRMAMANSVEGRYPFLDHRVMEFCAKLPDDFKLKGLNEKILLKRLMKDQLPQNVISRPKQAYRAPIASALRNHKLIDTYLNQEKVRKSELFDNKGVEKLVAKLKAGKLTSEVDNMAMIGILSSQIWFQKFIDKPDVLNDTELLKGKIRNKHIVIR